jgi:hypothetical protein
LAFIAKKRITTNDQPPYIVYPPPLGIVVKIRKTRPRNFALMDKFRLKDLPAMLTHRPPAPPFLCIVRDGRREVGSVREGGRRRKGRY